MQVFLIILLVVFIIWPLVREPVSRWFSTFMARRAEDMMRRMMGMPTRKEERRRRKKAERDRRKRGSAASPSGTRNQKGGMRAAEMMKKVAVDVEYTEIKEFESTTITEEKNGKTRIVIEEQITDAEYTEIKGSRTSGN